MRTRKKNNRPNRTRKKSQPEVQADTAYSNKEDEVIAKYRAKANSPLSCIRAKCVECMGGHVHEIKECTAKDSCSLWPLRMGINAFDKRVQRRMRGDNDES